MNRKLLVIPLLLLSASCVNSVRVWGEDCDGKPVKLKGLPFYGKTQNFKRTSVHELQWLEATMTVTVSGEEGDVTDKHTLVSTRIVLLPGTSALKHVEDLAKSDLAASRRTSVGDFFRLPVLSVPEPCTNLGQLVADHIEPIVVVNYEDKMYLNAPLPWSGSSTISANYNGDGTLGEVSVATTQDVGAILPIKEIVSGALGLESFVDGPPPPTSSIDVKLIVLRKRRQVTFTKTRKLRDDLGATLDCMNPGDGYTVTTNSSSSSAASAANSFKFSGSVTPPAKK